MHTHKNQTPTERIDAKNCMLRWENSQKEENMIWRKN